MTLAQRVYLRLHEARSKFVHGDKVSVKLLLTDGDEAPPLLLTGVHYLPHSPDGLSRRALAPANDFLTGDDSG